MVIITLLKLHDHHVWAFLRIHINTKSDTLHEITFTPLAKCTKCIQVSSDLCRNGYAH